MSRTIDTALPHEHTTTAIIDTRPTGQRPDDMADPDLDRPQHYPGPGDASDPDLDRSDSHETRDVND